MVLRRGRDELVFLAGRDMLPVTGDDRCVELVLNTSVSVLSIRRRTVRRRVGVRGRRKKRKMERIVLLLLLQPFQQLQPGRPLIEF